MKKLFSIIMSAAVMLCAFMAAADEISITDKCAYVWTLDPEVEDNNGNTGNVYKTTVEVSGKSAGSLAFYTKSDCTFEKGTYRLSMWFMEDINNPAQFTRSWAPEVPGNNYQAVTPTDRSYFYRVTNIANAAPLGEWQYVSMDFEVDDTMYEKLNTPAEGTTKQGIYLKWRGRGADTNFAYDESLNGDYTLYIANVEIIKYEEEPEPTSTPTPTPTAAPTTAGVNWADEDIYESESGEQIILPMQIPSVDYSWVKDASIPDNNGETGNVYKGTVNVSKSSASKTALTINGYKFTEGTYHLSMWFMEDINNPAPYTRRWIPRVYSPDKSSYTDLRKSNGEYFYMARVRANSAKQGEWTEVTMDFNVDETTLEALNANGITLIWGGRALDRFDFDYSEALNGIYNLYISNVELKKYPHDSSNTVGIKSDTVTSEENSVTKTELEGYIDTSKLIYLMADGFIFEGKASEIQTTDKYTKAILNFDTHQLRDGEYSALLGVTDLWGKKKEIPIKLNVNGAWSYDVSANAENGSITAKLNAENNSDEDNMLNAVFIIVGYDTDGNMKAVNFENISTEVLVGSGTVATVKLENYNSGYVYKAFLVDSLANLNVLADCS